MKYLLLIFTLIYSGASQSQTIETIKINETRTYEVTAALLSENKIVAVWMEARQERVVSSQAKDMQVAYAVSNDYGKSWTKKKIIDKSKTLLSGNPYIVSDKSGNVYLILMHVGNNFFSGELVLYEFENKKNEFKLKSIPANSHNKLLDKPSMSICDNRLYLTYVEYNNMLDTGLLKIQSSSDRGRIWTNSKTIFPENNVIALGPAISCFNNNLLLSFGSFWSDAIYFTKKNAKNIFANFQSPNIVSKISDTLVSAMTEIVTNNKNKIAVGWENNHQPNEIYISLSNDNGVSWNKPTLISKSGNMLSMAFDKADNLLILYNEFNGNKFSAVYERLSSLNGNMERKIFLCQPSEIIGTRDYIGAYQKIISTKNNSILVFWINFSDDNKLYFSKLDNLK